jgi:hypothetical protein
MKTKVRQMTSPKTSNPVSNQFIIYTPKGRYFQSYNSIIAFIPNNRNHKTQLDEYYWDYSRTTSKYRNEFLNENTQETKKKIKNKTYKLTNLNK